VGGLSVVSFAKKKQKDATAIPNSKTSIP